MTQRADRAREDEWDTTSLHRRGTLLLPAYLSLPLSPPVSGTVSCFRLPTRQNPSLQRPRTRARPLAFSAHRFQLLDSSKRSSLSSATALASWPQLSWLRAASKSGAFVVMVYYVGHLRPQCFGMGHMLTFGMSSYVRIALFARSSTRTACGTVRSFSRASRRARPARVGSRANRRCCLVSPRRLADQVCDVVKPRNASSSSTSSSTTAGSNSSTAGSNSSNTTSGGERGDGDGGGSGREEGHGSGTSGGSR